MDQRRLTAKRNDPHRLRPKKEVQCFLIDFCIDIKLLSKKSKVLKSLLKDFWKSPEISVILLKIFGIKRAQLYFFRALTKNP